MCDLLSPLPMDEDEIFVAHMSSTSPRCLDGLAQILHLSDFQCSIHLNKFVSLCSVKEHMNHALI